MASQHVLGEVVCVGVVLTDSRIEWDRRGIRVAHVCKAL